jgi:GNAT superfamily N-acetyltransferase
MQLVTGTELVPLRDGTIVLLRPVDGDDADALERFIDALSLQSRYLRFCSGGANWHLIALRLAGVGDDRCGVVASDEAGVIVAHAEYAILKPGVAEVALVVADHLQGKGLGPRLIEWLAGPALAQGVGRFVASVLPGNDPMLTVFTRRFGARVRSLSDACWVRFPVPGAASAAAAADKRAA